jgi:leucyl aminopeptidase
MNSAVQPIPTITLAGGDPAAVRAPLLFIVFPTGATLPSSLEGLDRALNGAIRTAFETRDFRGARDEILYLTGPSNGPRRIALLGTGSETLTPVNIRRAGGIAARNGARLGVGEVALFADGLTPELIEAAVIGLSAGAWQYTETKTPPPEKERKTPLSAMFVVAEASEANERALQNGIAIGAGYTLARSVAMLPGNLCTPDYLAEIARQLSNRHGLTYTTLDRAGLQREGMGAFLSVAQGTPQEPRLVAMEYKGGKADDAPIVLIGKGLCFDSGGISIKPAQGMELMKFDMSGAAGVIGAMEAVAQLKLPINVVGIFGATTNMPSGTAVKPGDVVRSQIGKYIEIINTDAEGRLVLADLLSYARRFKPAAVIDAATLTGAIVIALGNNITGVFGSDDALVKEVLRAGERAGERSWELPMLDEYKELISSDVADVKNAGGRAAGSITAALFLKEFVDGFPWVHLDIAGTAYSESDMVWIPKGPTGTPVGTFVEFLRARAAQ